ncbi:MAG: hypothetical protein Q8919_01295 [Bacteroidota bacterium]|nr:hypothetical protein [Bacteroidota bacterium]
MTVFIFYVLLLGSKGNAQVSTSDVNIQQPKHFAENIFGVGLHASLVSGLGLSFRQRLAGTVVAYQISGGIIKVDRSLYYDLGGELQFDLSGSDRDRLYVVGGTGYYFSGEVKNSLFSSAPDRHRIRI